MNMMKAKIRFTMKPMVMRANRPLDLLLEIKMIKTALLFVDKKLKLKNIRFKVTVTGT